MTRKIRRIIIAVVILTAMAAAVTTGLRVLRSRRSQPVDLTAYFHLYSSPAKERLTVLLNEFEDFYPRISLEYRILPYRDMRAELLTALESRHPESPGLVSVLTGKDLELLPAGIPAPAPWIFSGWELYYSAPGLSELGYTRDDLIALSDSGLENFIGGLAGAAAGDTSLFAVGTAFFWPRLAWVQHLELLALNGESPPGFAPSDWKAGIDAWNEMREKGLFNEDAESTNFADSQLAAGDGRSLFVLSDATIYSTYPPQERALIESIPFPGTVKQGWSIGSSFYLAGFSDSEIAPDAAEAEELLIDYLGSPGVTERYLRETGIRLLPRENRASVREIPSLSQRAGEPELQELLKYAE